MALIPESIQHYDGSDITEESLASIVLPADDEEHYLVHEKSSLSIGWEIHEMDCVWLKNKEEIIAPYRQNQFIKMRKGFVHDYTFYCLCKNYIFQETGLLQGRTESCCKHWDISFLVKRDVQHSIEAFQKSFKEAWTQKKTGKETRVLVMFNKMKILEDGLTMGYGTDYDIWSVKVTFSSPELQDKYDIVRDAKWLKFWHGWGDANPTAPSQL